MKFKIKTIALLAAAASAAAALSGCGGGGNAEPSPAAQAQTGLSQEAQSELTGRYSTYIESFISDVGAFVDGDLSDILQQAGEVDSGSLEEWKTKYQDGYESVQHWYNEVSTAEMLCAEENLEAHRSIVETVAAIYRILEGLEPRVQAAESGDFSRLSEKSGEYKQADTIIKDMWQQSVENVRSTLN
ncbi:MAG TPA: hypothetical protein H9900_02690 [Candidatus Monoglobus merdigallinarum]|uniref:Lipoprotein n=1 Tax=Candidatus Monoglobus merdigallinarum TaxID=2838698 RepID=A0A9D1PPV5_9FIRM|nr:hypothetical protein [Candidatus Monoglobus merdigallinarum]